MKKIILLIICIFFTSGCADYKELNSLSYITGIGIDYQDDNFIYTYEVMDNKKEGNAVVTETYVVSGKGKTTVEAKYDAGKKLSNSAYFTHSQVLILTDEVVEHKLLEVVDSIVRKPEFNEEFKFFITTDNSPEEIFNNTTKFHPSVSLYIDSLVTNNDYTKNYLLNLPFTVFTQRLVENKYDPAVSVIKINEDDIVIDGLAIFDNNKIIDIASDNYSNLYLAMSDGNINIIESILYKDENIEGIVNFSSVDIEVTSSKININIDSTVELKQVSNSVILDNNSIYEDIEKLFEQSINENLEEFISYLQLNNSDILGFENIYYIKYRSDNNDLWKYADVDINTQTTVSRKGLINNVNN